TKRDRRNASLNHRVADRPLRSTWVRSHRSRRCYSAVVRNARRAARFIGQGELHMPESTTARAQDQRLGRNDLEAYWLPFTANRQFKSAPRLLVSAKGMHYQM